MLPTFVIGLREGLEAALIVGIVAAFLRTNGRRGDLRRMWLGVLAAIALCIAVGIGLQQLSDGLPQRQQEMLECVIAVVAVAMVTFMILWMRTHTRTMKSSLEGAASSALATGSAWALVGMAFLAVLREGFETSVFLLAALQNSASGLGPLAGALIGIAVSLVLGWAIYRGALRFNMGKFFTVTSVFLVLVAAGLVMKTFRAAHEAGWLTIGQQPTFDLSAVVARGSVGEAILGGIFGLQAQPVLIEVLGYLAYAIPMLLVVLLPARLAGNLAVRRTLLAGGAAACVLVAAAGLLLAPSPSQATNTVATVQSASAESATVTVDDKPLEMPATEHLTIDGVDCIRYETSTSAPAAGGAPTLTGDQIKSLRGRYPVGITEFDAQTAFPATYVDTKTTTIDIDPQSHAVVGYAVTSSRIATVTLATGSEVKVGAIESTTDAQPDAQTSAALDSARSYASDTVDHEVWAKTVPLIALTLALILAAFALAAGRRTPTKKSPASKPAPRALAGSGA